MNMYKRQHTYRKEILRFADLDLKSFSMDTEFGDFMRYIDEIQKADSQVMSKGRWKKLYAILQILSNKTNINYRIYQNKFNIFFDVTSNCIGTEDEISEENEGFCESSQNVKESAVEKLKRYKYELAQIDLKIAHLQERRKEYIVKIEPLKHELASLLKELSEYGSLPDDT